MSKPEVTVLTNWAGNYAYQAKELRSPQSIEELQEIFRSAEQVKALGSRHSFNGVADTTGTLISFAHLNRIIHLDAVKQTVSIEAGVTYGQLCPYLNEQGFALANLASLPHITVVGSCMTGTHGSGVASGNLATSVVAIEFLDAQGDEAFAGMVVGLGAYGLVISMTLRIIPRFEMWQQVVPQLPHTTLFDHYEEIVRSAYSVSLFSSWQHAHIDQVWLKGQTEQAPFETFFGLALARQTMHPIPDGDTQAVTEQLGKRGAWYERLPHFKLGFQPSSGREIQSEYFVGIEKAVEAIQALHAIQSQFAAHLFIGELRTIAADHLWLSPAYQRASIGFHFTWHADSVALKKVLPLVEAAALLPFAVRPHWGKVYTLDHAYV